MQRSDGLPKKSRWEGHTKASPVCKLCGENDRNNFYKDSYSPCKSCRIKCAAESKIRQRNSNPVAFRAKNVESVMRSYWKDPQKYRDKANNWRKENLELARERSRENYKNGGREKAERYREENRERVNELARKYRDRDPEAYNEKTRIWRKNNPDKLKSYYDWLITEYPEYLAFNAANRRARLKSATPKWVDFDKIYEIYQKCAEISSVTGIEYHVDHIIPLQGKNVCGLHVDYNLQILSWEENIKKSNKLLY